MIRYYIVKEEFADGGWEKSSVLIHKFPDYDSAKEFSDRKNAEQTARWGEGFSLDKHDFSEPIEENLKFEGEGEPEHDYGGGFDFNHY